MTKDREELANVYTHALGVLLGLVGTYQMLAIASPKGWWSALVFCLSALLLYGASTIYHSVEPPALKYLWQRLDHIGIYFLIAGSHTPFLYLLLSQSMAFFYLVLLWGLAVLGTLYKIFFFGRWPWLSLATYVGMGWLGALTLPVMAPQLSMLAYYSIIGGGLAYTIGVFFFIWHRLPYHHAIWHLFVLLGTGLHFLAVWEVVR